MTLPLAPPPGLELHGAVVPSLGMQHTSMWLGILFTLFNLASKLIVFGSDVVSVTFYL